jgi:hypothetical protein
MRVRYTYPDNPNNGLKQGQEYEVVCISEGDIGIIVTVIVDTVTGPTKVKELSSHFRRSTSPIHVSALPETKAAKVFGLTAILYICELQMRSGVPYVKCKVVGGGNQPPDHRQTFILDRNFKLLDE